MFRHLVDASRRYPIVVATAASGVLAGALVATGLGDPSNLVLIVLGSVIVLRELWRMIRDFRSGRWGLDILAISAIIATLALAEYWAAFVVTLMVVGGEALEANATARAQRQISALLARAPRIAHRMEAGAEHDIPVDDVRVGDRLLVKAGEVVPVDGTLLDEDAEFDESSMTGESLPVTRQAGSVIASGIVVGARAIRLLALAPAADSQYQRIVAMVEEGASTRGRFVRLADRIAIPFTGVAYAIAIAAWIATGDPVRFAEVLVVATPCPLLVAAPTAIVAGMGRAARGGVVVKSGDTLERLARVRSAAFDKTGTLTRGHPQVDRCEPADGFDAEVLLALAAEMESSSAHILAEAIVTRAEQGELPAVTVSDVEEITGSGLQGVWTGLPVVIGKAAFVESRTGPSGAGPLGAGEMSVSIGIGGRFAGRIILRDEVRADAAEVVAQLRSLGIDQIAMLTGDGADNAGRVAAEVGIDQVHASMLPADKVAVVATMQPRPVLMVGDGVNDAPVLAAADVGIAMGARGSTAASESAEVVLLVDELSRIPAAIGIARRTMWVARQSIVVGIGLSLAVMVVAAFGIIPAIAGALIQEAIDVVTILNGLRAGFSGREATRQVGNRNAALVPQDLRH